MTRIPDEHSVTVAWADDEQPIYWEYRNSAMGELIASGIRDGDEWVSLVDGPVPTSVAEFLTERGVHPA